MQLAVGNWRLAVAAETQSCFVCLGRLRSSDGRDHARHRGESINICTPCRGRYAFIAEQITAVGDRFRWVRKSEIPTPPVFGDRDEISGVLKYRLYRRIYMILLLLKEREEKRRKEVNWMVDEMTRKILKLPDRVAAIVGKTFVVCGDDFTLTDDEALTRIRDLLEEIDPAIMKRNKKKRLSRT